MTREERQGIMDRINFLQNAINETLYAIYGEGEKCPDNEILEMGEQMIAFYGEELEALKATLPQERI